MLKKIRLFSLLLPILFLFWGGSWVFASDLSLTSRLIKEKNLSQTLVQRYCPKKYEKLVDSGIIGKNLKQSEYKAAYDNFLAPASVKKAQVFLDKNRNWLTAIESKFQVDASVIVAIFLVESDLGRYPGRYSLLKVFISLAVCDQERYLRKVFVDLKESYPELDYGWLKRRARKKSAWGYSQLVALLQLADRLDPDKVKGSWAGAFGICQFIPSSCLTYAVDGSGDGRIDLYNFKDAGASVANYLKLNGWHKGLNIKQKEKVIWSYNHSRLYCETVVSLAGRLR